MIAMVRNEINRFETDFRVRLNNTKVNTLKLKPEEALCPQCERGMRVRKTRNKNLVTIQYGALSTQVTTLICKKGCKTLDGRPVLRNPKELSQLVPAGANFGYDVEVFVGIERYLNNLQREEIKEKLREKHDIPISVSGVSVLARRFVEHVKTLHWSCRKRIRREFAADGGSPWHIDATGEDGTGTILIVYAGWRKWVLGSWKLTTECSEQIKPRLHEVADQFGMPCAVVRDYGRAMIPTVQEFIKERKAKIPILGCHTHFIKIVGKDLLTSGYDDLRGLVRKYKIQATLRRLVREWARNLGDQIPSLRTEIENWTTQPQNQPLPKGEAGLATVRALAQWALDYLAAMKNQRFPFQLPYLEFYRRCKAVRQACDIYMKYSQEDKIVYKALRRLACVTDPVISELRFCQVDQILSYRAKLFNELRVVLKLNSNTSGKKLTPGVQEPQQAANELNDIKKSLRNFKASLKRRYPKRGPAQDKRQAIESILKHLKKHEKSLWGQVIFLPKRAGGGIKIVCRTNNCIESFNGSLKQGERRRSGRKILSKDFEDLPEGTPLIKNLRQPDYVKLVCGSLEKLPEAFAELDQNKHTWKTDSRTQKVMPETPETASLPKIERQFIRRINIWVLIQNVALSRSPRIPISAR